MEMFGIRYRINNAHNVKLQRCAKQGNEALWHT